MLLKEKFLKIMKERRISLSVVMTGVVVCIVLVAYTIGIIVFSHFYLNSTQQNAITNSGQAVTQVGNMITAYTQDMSAIMEMIRKNMAKPEEDRNEFFENLISIRQDVEAITVHSEDGRLMAYWSDGKELKEWIGNNLSYTKVENEELYISPPHVQNLFQGYYPWVVTFTQRMQSETGEEIQVSMDIRFSNIASYVEEVGIGAHGYCFIADLAGNIVYHPQQQLIYAGLKEEQGDTLRRYQDGDYVLNGVIYSMRTLSNCSWRVVGVSYVDELVTIKVAEMVRLALFGTGLIVLTMAVAGTILARTFSKPAKELASAMRRFVREAEDFEFHSVKGTEEIVALSDSFGQMVLQIQQLMEKVRQEEITLRKTELNALQAQINPHFLYNTLDSIAWMCEVGRTKEAVEMVNALARLFRISISRGHELITVEQELQHAESYLKIQKFRYKNLFRYKFCVQESCLEYLCNKITLQPLIENAIVHGLDMADEGEILIEVFEKDQDIVMSVSDNGIGMTEEQCAEILRKEVHKKGGIGIKNVNDRVKIYFGEQYGVTIYSELDEGTKVEIRMPKLMEGNDEM